MDKNGKRKVFHIGGNSSCRQHIRQHYKIYKERCKEARIEMHHWVIPRQILQDAQAKKGKLEKQGSLDGIVVRLQEPAVFTREGLRHAVCQFITCDNQVSAHLFVNAPLNVVPLGSH
jgi:hypothetical protein